MLHMLITSCADTKQLCLYIPYMNSPQSIISQKALVYMYVTLFAYAPEQIYLSYNICMSHCTNTVVYLRTPQYCTYRSKNNKLQFLISKLLPYTCQQQICSSNAKCMSHEPITSCADFGQLYQHIYLI